MVVDDDAVVELEARPFEESGLRLDADADDDAEGLDLLAGRGHGAGQRAAVRAELLDLLPEQQLDAVLAVELRDLVGELLRGERRHQVVALLDERHLEPAHAQRRRDLGADEAAADDEDLARLGAFLGERHSIGERAERLDGRKVPPGTERSRGCAPLRSRASRTGATRRLRAGRCGLRVDGLDRGVEAQLDDEVVVLLGLVHERAVRLHLPRSTPFESGGRL